MGNSIKLFISYSWTNQDHETWVLNLAKELVENGVHVVIDKWDLKEGQDSYSFMEKMVSDTEIQKVLIISDKKYADKANGRDGGVGTETQIISAEVYKNRQQEKFVAAVVERDETGEAYLPVYYKSRIYIDFCEPENYADSFEKLLRWIYDKPLYKRPPIGKQPAFLNERDDIALGTSFLSKRVLLGLKEAKPYVNGAIEEYLVTLSTNIEALRIDCKPEEYDDKLIEKIDAFIPYRNEFIQICISVCQYSDDIKIDKFYHFFEKLIPYFKKHGTGSFYEHEFDVFKFIAYELFLYYVAILLKYEKFIDLDEFLDKQYMGSEDSYGYDVEGYLIFYNYLKSLDYRNRRLNCRKLSLFADIIKERAKHLSIDFSDLMQADFVLFLRAEHLKHNDWRKWYPQTLIYSEYRRKPMEIFFRAQSKKYFEKMKCAIGFDDVQELKSFIEEYYTEKREIPRWQHCSFSPKGLANSDNLCSKR